MGPRRAIDPLKARAYSSWQPVVEAARLGSRTESVQHLKMTDPNHPLLTKIDRLVALCEQMQRDNQQLLERQTALLTERSQLVEQNELARQKIELMINRLRGLNAEQ